MAPSRAHSTNVPSPLNPSAKFQSRIPEKQTLVSHGLKRMNKLGKIQNFRSQRRGCTKKKCPNKVSITKNFMKKRFPTIDHSLDRDQIKKMQKTAIKLKDITEKPFSQPNSVSSFSGDETESENQF